jgi:hypothetical protein
MNHLLPRWARLVAALLWFGLAPLMAQLNPVLRTSETDFLDLYQKSAAQVIKPEIITVLDMSGSMNAVMWHPSYYTDSNEEDHILGTGYFGGDDAWARPYVRTFDRNTGPTINFLWYTNGNGTQTDPFKTDGVLIKADGTPVALADVGTSGNANRSAINWIKQATHVRMTMTRPGTSTTRTVDLPIPWKVFDSPAAAAALPSYSVSTAPDPQNGNAATEFDTLYSTDGNVYSTSDVTGYFPDRYLPGTFVGWLGHFWYTQDYLFWLFFGTDTPNDATNPTDSVPGASYVIPDTSKATAFNNGIPCLTRYQGVKRSVIMTWLANQTKVYWAYRFLDAADEQGTSSTRTTVDPGNGSQNGTGRNLRILRPATGNNADPSVRDLQSAEPSGGTPLTYAMGNALAQFNVLHNSVFDAPHTTDKYVSPQCQTMFLILFTDGIANDSGPNGSVIGTGNPYPTAPPSTRCNASIGNVTLKSAGTTALNPGQPYFNIQSLAGVAAHGADPSLNPDYLAVPTTYPTDSAQNLNRFAPFFVKQRGSGSANQTVFTTPRPIQTFTVGVSLAGSYLETDSSKYSLLLSAAAGDPNQTSWDISRAVPYSAANTGTFFFDARDPSVLVNSLITAIQSAIDIANRQTTAAPSIPFSGVALANQVYIGQFKPASGGGPVWTGDLMMFPTRTQNLTTTMVDATGGPLQYLDCSTAMWSVARDVFNVASANTSGGGSAGRGCGASSGSSNATTGCGPSGNASPVNWSTRRILTRLAATSAAPNPDVTLFSDADPAFTTIKGSLPASLTTDAARKDLINYVRGADLTSTATPRANRSTIMGDIIDSVPSALEYRYSGVTFNRSLPSNVQTALTSHPGAHLRVVFVGTNQGYLHAFAEATWPAVQSVNGTSVTVTNGTVGELWAFLPTDFLPYLDYLENNTNSHRYGANGTPLVYTLDLPPAGAVAGNGLVDPTEKAMVVFGLRKGGRGYYALDVHDPTDPHVVWVVRPEESATMPSARFLNGDPAGGRSLVANMGLSTSYLSTARVVFGNKLRDVLLLGGGSSSSALETSLGSTSLGRSVLAVDIQTGEILQTWDLLRLSGLTSSTVGPVSTGVVPFQAFPSSGMHQRGYFTDAKGGVWAIGSGRTRTSEPLRDFRTDTSYLDQWVNDSGGLSLRRLYSDASANGVITTLPDPVLLPDFPVLSASSSNLLHPTAVAIPFVTGNRSNPLDFNYGTGNPAPTRHRINVIFDRQDSKLTGVDAAPITSATMADFTSSTDPNAGAINPNDSSYYLRTKYGYYVNFPAATSTTSGGSTTYYIPKGITDPSVLSMVLFYSYFTPTQSDPCQGGQGITSTYAICSLLNPLVDSSNDPSATCVSGNRATWTGVASNFSAVGTVAVIQAGMVIPTTAPPSGDSTIMSLQTLPGNTSERYPRIRVWRTVPRS